MAATLTMPAPMVETSGWTLPPWFALIRRKVQRARLSEEEERLLRLVEFAAAKIGADLLKAQGLDDLDDRIDAALERPDLERFLGLAAGSVTVDMLDRARATEPTEQEVEHFGFGAAPLLRQALQLSAQVAEVLASALREHGNEEIRQGVDELLTGKPLAFLSDPRLPPEIGLCILGAFKASVCSLAMCAALLATEKLDPWLVRAILERWIEGQRTYLRFLASIPEMHVPEHVVPTRDRVDLRRIEHDDALAQVRFAALAEEARQAGAAVYPYAVEPGDE